MIFSFFVDLTLLQIILNKMFSEEQIAGESWRGAGDAARQNRLWAAGPGDIARMVRRAFTIFPYNFWYLKEVGKAAEEAR
jgi:hypothetical protein